MRDLVFKNLFSQTKNRRVISSSEIVDEPGMRSIFRRHFVYIIRELNDSKINKPMPYLYILKERNSKAQKERFFCRIKGGIYVIKAGKPFLLLFMHSLKITFIATSDNAITK